MERVSQTMMSRMFLQDMYGSLNRMLDVEQQLSSGQVYSRPSDNPSEVVRGMALESTLVSNEQYVRNLDDAITRLANTETAFGQITDCISAIREDVVQACGPGLSPVDREAIAQEIEALRQEIIQAANYSVEGIHLLSGSDTTQAAFRIADDGSVVYQGDMGHITFEVEQGTVGQVSLNGRDVFPVDYERRSIGSVEVPMDFRWSGSTEILQFRVGDRTADVTIPERWSDDNGDNITDGSDFDGFRSPADQVGGYSLQEITDLINAELGDGGAGNLVKASVQTDSVSGTQTLTIQSLSGESLQVTSFPQVDNNERGQWAASLEPEVVAPATEWKAPSGGGEIVVSFSGGESHIVAVTEGQTVGQVASALSALPGLWAGSSGNGIVLVAEGETEPFTVTASGGAGELFVQPVCESGPIEGNHDVSHTGLASLLGFQTAVNSTEVADGKTYDTTQADQNLAIKFVSGSNNAELKIDDDSDLTLEEFAQRLRGVAGDWLEVIVEEDEGKKGFPLVDKLGNTYYPTKDNENPTQRLVLRTHDGMPLNIYDVAGSGDYAAKLGIGTARTAVKPPSLPAEVTTERPARIGVEVGGEMFEVKLFSDQISADGSAVDMDSVALQILEQVGSDSISVDISDDGDFFALFSPNGEPVRVVDLPYADSDMEGTSSGLAAAMGLQSGVTGELVDSTGTLTVLGGTAGAFVLSTGAGARSLEISVADTDTLSDVAEKIREQAGSWLDVSISEENVAGEQQISLSAKDGSAVSIYDVTGNSAQTFRLNTDVRATGSWSDGDTLDITVDGYTHGIDLTGVTTIEGVAELVNARFPGMDVQAELVAEGGNEVLSLSSPRGKSISVGLTKAGAGPDLMFKNPVTGGYDLSNAGSTPTDRGGAGPNGQNVVVRTGANVEDADLFGVLEDLASAVRQGDVEGLSNRLLPELDKGLDDVLQARSYCGALEVRYKAGRTRLTEDKVALTDLYSRVMDVDMAEAAMEFQTSQAIYQATLAAMSKVIQPTLVDYLT